MSKQLDRVLAYAPVGTPRGRGRSWLRRVVLAVVVVSLALPLYAVVALAMKSASPPAAAPAVAPPMDLGMTVTPPPAPATQPTVLLMPPPPRFDVAKVRAASVRPHLEAMKLDNATARGRAEAMVRAHFAQAHAGAGIFAGEIIGPLDGIKSLYLAGKGGAGRWWREDSNYDPLRAHVAWNYEQHVTSGPKIERAIRDALAQFDADLRANRNHALQAIARDLSADTLAVKIALDPHKLGASCDAQVRHAVAQLMAQNVAEGAAVESFAVIVASEGLGAASGIVVRLVVTKLATIPLSAAVAGTGTGATLGSIVPGVGNAAGAVTGLLVGITVDCVLTHKQTQRVTKSVQDVLASTEQAVIEGHNGAAGLGRVFSDALRAQDEAIDRLVADELYAAADPAAAERSGT
jgi:hypothetical protein